MTDTNSDLFILSHPDYYNNGTACLNKKAYGSKCSNSYECYDYQGQICTSSVCGCPTNTFWNKTNWYVITYIYPYMLKLFKKNII